MLYYSDELFGVIGKCAIRKLYNVCGDHLNLLKLTRVLLLFFTFYIFPSSKNLTGSLLDMLYCTSSIVHQFLVKKITIIKFPNLILIGWILNRNSRGVLFLNYLLQMWNLSIHYFRNHCFLHASVGKEFHDKAYCYMLI